MSKIICDICGTTYPDTESECPICGCAKDVSAASLADELMEKEAEAVVAADLGSGSKKKPVIYADLDDEDEYDEADDEDEEYDDEDEDEDDDEDDEEEHKSNAPLVILLVIVILLLIAVSAFILVRYFLPNVMAPETAAPSVVETTEMPTETTEMKIACETLALTGATEIVLEEEGANWLINVMALPENTTDDLIYTSSDESVVMVNENGKLTAVGEGTAVITITCGEQELKCTVTCSFTPETTVPETTVPETTVPETTVPETTVPVLPDVTISFVKNDVTSRMIGEQFYLKVSPADLDPSLLTWSSENEYICKVDQTGLVTITGRGTTHVYVEYNGQKIECIVRVY